MFSSCPSESHYKYFIQFGSSAAVGPEREELAKYRERTEKKKKKLLEETTGRSMAVVTSRTTRVLIQDSDVEKDVE